MRISINIPEEDYRRLESIAKTYGFVNVRAVCKSLIAVLLMRTEESESDSDHIKNMFDSMAHHQPQVGETDIPKTKHHKQIK